MTTHAFRVGDFVCYSLSHWTYLRMIGRWTSPFVPRRAVRGRVVGVDGQVVRVEWQEKAKHECRDHLVDNLELCLL